MIKKSKTTEKYEKLIYEMVIDLNKINSDIKNDGFIPKHRKKISDIKTKAEQNIKSIKASKNKTNADLIPFFDILIIKCEQAKKHQKN